MVTNQIIIIKKNNVLETVLYNIKQYWKIFESNWVFFFGVLSRETQYEMFKKILSLLCEVLLFSTCYLSFSLPKLSSILDIYHFIFIISLISYNSSVLFNMLFCIVTLFLCGSKMSKPFIVKVSKF